MKLAILGATGGTGQELTKQALALGHTVKLLVRSPDKVSFKNARLEVLKIDLLNDSVSTLADKLGGSDAVLSALGIKDLGITHFYSESAKQLVAAVKQAQVKRLMIVSSVGTDPSSHEPRWYLWLVRRLLINTYVDMARMEQFVMDQDGLEWIIVRPSYLTNGKRTGVYRVTLRHTPEGGIRISRADLAEFMLKQLEQDTFLHKTPALAY